MKLIKRIISNLYHVVSEPGDATRYDYFIYLSSPEDFSFMPGENTFRYPQRLNRFKFPLEMTQDAVSLREKADLEVCNPHTLKECIKSMYEEDIQYEEVVYDSDLYLYPYKSGHFGGSKQS